MIDKLEEKEMIGSWKEKMESLVNKNLKKFYINKTEIKKFLNCFYA
jgi:hypothetical protein